MLLHMQKHSKGHETWYSDGHTILKLYTCKAAPKDFHFPWPCTFSLLLPCTKPLHKKDFSFAITLTSQKFFFSSSCFSFSWRKFSCEASKSTRKFSFSIGVWRRCSGKESAELLHTATTKKNKVVKMCCWRLGRNERKNAERPKKTKVNLTSERKQGRARVTFITSIERINITYSMKHTFSSSFFSFFFVNA